MRVVPFQPEHVLALKIQPRQSHEYPIISREEAERMLAAGPGFSAIGEDGTIYGAAGIIPQWPGRAIAWAMFAYNAGPHFVRITREVRRYLDTCGYERIEAAVDAMFPQAIRWIEMLGFERETP